MAISDSHSAVFLRVGGGYYPVSLMLFQYKESGVKGEEEYYLLAELFKFLLRLIFRHCN